MTKRLLIMAAGTGGHIIPGLAIAQTMQQQGWTVSWLGTTHGMENELVPPTGIEMDRIAFSGVRGKGIKHTLLGGFKLVASFFKCYGFLKKRKPDVILGMGGYVTVPGGLMAKLRGVPLVLANADAALLLSNKVLVPYAKKILFGFPGQQGLPADKMTVTGNPVRKTIAELTPPAVRYAQHTGKLRILVVGGSLGAQVLNESVPKALALIPEEQRPVVTHQSGKKHLAQLTNAYAQAGVEAEIVDFIDDMPEKYAQSDIVICRAGAITVSELTAAGVASILVPLVVSTTSHQKANAVWMAENNAAIYMPQNDLTPEALAKRLTVLDRAACQSLAQAAYEQGRRNANEAIAQVLENVSNQ